MDLLSDVRARNTRLVKLVEGLTDAEARGDSALPGWSRGHVLSHLAYLSTAFARQVDHAVDGKLVEVYDGGRPARDAAIEAGSGRPAAELRQGIVDAVDVFERAVARLGPDDLDRPVIYRAGVVRDVLDSHWRELEIHTTDLRLGYTTADWTPEFCAHVIDYLLAARSPEGVRLVLVAQEQEWAGGDGRAVEVRGALTDLTAWLAGRQPKGVLDGAVPELAPWP
jgi:maleylpyruvate isomerase